MEVTLCDPIWHVNSSSGVATSVSELLYPCYFTLLFYNRPPTDLQRAAVAASSVRSHVIPMTEVDVIRLSFMFVRDVERDAHYSLRCYRMRASFRMLIQYFLGRIRLSDPDPDSQ